MAYTGTYWIELAGHSTNAPGGTYDLAPMKVWVKGIDVTFADISESGKFAGSVLKNAWGYRRRYNVKTERYLVAGNSTSQVGILQSDIDAIVERLASQYVFITDADMPRTCDIAIGTGSGNWWTERIADAGSDGILCVREAFPAGTNNYDSDGTMAEDFVIVEYIGVRP